MKGVGLFATRTNWEQRDLFIRKGPHLTAIGGYNAEQLAVLTERHLELRPDAPDVIVLAMSAAATAAVLL